MVVLTEECSFLIDSNENNLLSVYTQEQSKLLFVKTFISGYNSLQIITNHSISESHYYYT